MFPVTLKSTNLWQLESGDCYAEFVPRMVQIGISKLFEVTREKDQSSLVSVLVGLQTKGALSAEQLLGGIRKSTDQLEDLRSACCLATTRAPSTSAISQTAF